MDQYSRTRLLLGDAAMEKLKNARVAVFGLGGVGGYVVEALARSGIGAAILPAQFAESHHFRERITLFTLKHDAPIRQPVVVTRKGQYLSGYAKAAIELLTK